MPKKPLKPCAVFGCPNLTEGRFCEKHKKEDDAKYEKYGRDPLTRKRYGNRWRVIRQKYVETHPFCEECFKNGEIVPVEHVHHIKPLREGGTHATSNLISLCKTCHSRIHAQRGDRWHR